MSAASSFMTHSNGYQAAPAMNRVFPLANKSLIHESRQVQSSFLDTIVGRRGGLREVLSQVEMWLPATPRC
jgi:hypothetical protein